MKPSILFLLLMSAVAVSQGQTKKGTNTPSPSANTAPAGYAVSVSLKPYKNTYVYLGYHYGKSKALADSALLNAEGKGVFKGNEPLPGGIYFIVSPSKQILFELLLDKDQQFSIAADSSALPGGIVFTGSADNNLFQQYTERIKTIGEKINGLREELNRSTTSKDSSRINNEIQKNTAGLQNQRDTLIKKYPSSLLAALLQAMKEPVVPPVSQHPGGKYDSAFVYRYYKSHYWEGVNLGDARLVRTPFFEAKLDKYFNELVPPNPDSIKAEVDHMLLYARSSKEMFKFLMVHFVQKYINPKYMGQDAVFVHLFEKYVNAGQTDFFTQQYKEFMTKRAYSLMANLIGQPAANMQMVDTLDKPLALYDVPAELTIVVFWDPSCSHCKEVVPKVDSFYHAKWKQQGVKVYGVLVDGGKEAWLQFIHDRNLKDWLHVYQLPSQAQKESEAGKAGYRQLYDVYQTPILYLLDKDKRIIAKKLDYQQLDEVIGLKLKNPSIK